MTTEEQINNTRRARERRDSYWTAATLLFASGFAITIGMSLAGNDSTLLPLGSLAFAAFSAAGPLVVDGADELQRYRVLRSFAIASAICLVYLIVDAVLISVNTSYRTQPGLALRTFSASWLLISLAPQVRAIFTNDEEVAA